jgi:hypothetical protein
VLKVTKSEPSHWPFKDQVKKREHESNKQEKKATKDAKSSEKTQKEDSHFIGWA